MSMSSPERVVASWSYHVAAQDDAPDAWLTTMIDVASASARVLADLDLMRPAWLRLTSWLTWAGGHPVVARMPELSIPDLLTVGREAVLDSVRAHATAYDASGAQPHQGRCRGPGRLVTPSGDRSRELIGLALVDDGVGVTLTVTSYTDAWLLFAPNGRSQTELARLNAPRLKQALKKLSLALGTGVDPQPPTVYAVATETGLENHRDADGELVDISGEN